MWKVPSKLDAKITVSDITLEVPKPLFESAAIKVAVFFGRKGKSSLTQRTKWFTVADPTGLPSSTRQMTVLPDPNEERRASSTRRASNAVSNSEENSMQQVNGDLVVIKFSSLNDVVYDTELRPLSRYENEWVFHPKSSHPLMAFVKVFIKPRQGAKGNAAKSEQESNLHEMLQMDQSEMDDEFSDGENGVADFKEVSVLKMDGVELTVDQLAALSDGKSENEVLIEALKEERDCKKRYLSFPTTLDLASVANTRSKRLEFSERLKCKSASLLGSVLSFSITAVVDESALAKFETEKKDEKYKEERKRREKEEKVLEKEKKKREKAEAKARKKRGEEQAAYGCEVSDLAEGSGAAAVAETSNDKAPEGAGKQKTRFLPLSIIDSVFSTKKESKTTPFPIKCEHSPYPYLFLLDNFVLHKLVMPPSFYRGVHIRLGCDNVRLDSFPLLLLSTEPKSYLKEETITGYDGQPKNISKFDFGDLHVYFADKHIRNVTGFDTIRALAEHEREFKRAKQRAASGIEADEEEEQCENRELFHSELLNVGEKFHPVAFQSTKYSARAAQAERTPYTRVTAQLVIPRVVKNLTVLTDEEEKEAYLKRLKKEQNRLAKEEKERIKAEKKAAKAKSAAEPSSEDEGESGRNDDVRTEVGDSRGESGNVPTPAINSEEPKEGNGHSADAKESNGHSAGAKEGNGHSAKAEEENEPSAEVNEENGNSAEVKEGDAAEADGSVAPGGASESTSAVGAQVSAAPKASKDSRFSLNKSRSFQLGIHLVNEENIPTDGINYAIRFETGEELVFRARRIYLPSVSPVGEAGATSNDKSLLAFSPNA